MGCMISLPVMDPRVREVVLVSITGSRGSINQNYTMCKHIWGYPIDYGVTGVEIDRQLTKISLKLEDQNQTDEEIQILGLVKRGLSWATTMQSHGDSSILRTKSINRTKKIK